MLTNLSVHKFFKDIDIFLNKMLRVNRLGYLIQEQPTLEIISVGSATQATSNLKRSFNIVLIIFS